MIDRVLRITDQMGEAELVRFGMCALRRQAIGQPHPGPQQTAINVKVIRRGPLGQEH